MVLIKFLAIVFCMCLDARKLGTWRGQESLVLGTPPLERYQHGFVEAIGRLYVFGGITRTSGSMDIDLARLDYDYLNNVA
jgi:hypothetical protein